VSELSKYIGDSEAAARAMAHEKLIVDVTQDLLLCMERDGVSMAALGRKLNKSRAFISATLDGSRNMTLRTLSGIAHALGLRAEVKFHDCETDAIPAVNQRVYKTEGVTMVGGSNASPRSDTTIVKAEIYARS